MNLIRNSVLKIHTFLQPNILSSYNWITNRSYSLLEWKKPIQAPQLLNSTSPLLEQVCGFKVKYKLHKRCKDCYLAVKDGRKYILCKTHPRHKQMSMIKKPRYTWILSDVSQTKIRPW